MSSEIIRWLDQIAREQLLGLAIASTLLFLTGNVAARLAANKGAAFRFSIWQLTCVAILSSSLVLVFTSGIPLAFTFPALWEVDTDGRATESLLSIDFVEPSGAVLQSTSEDALYEVAQPAERQAAVTNKPQTTAEMWRFSTLNASFFTAFLATVWIGILGIHVFALLWSVHQAFLISRSALDPLPTIVSSAFRNAQQLLGVPIDRYITLAVSREVRVPLTIGFVRPTIVLPHGCEAWEESKLELVLAHELAHVERYDVFWHWLNQLACCVAWFNPLVWMAARSATAERERACDDRVLQAGKSATDYGDVLVEIAASLRGRGQVLTGAVSLAESPLQTRLRAILSKSECRDRIRNQAWLGLALFFIACSILLGVVRPLANSVASETLAATEEETYAASEIPTRNESDKLVQLPDSVTGSVTNLDGFPIADATVVVVLAEFFPSDLYGGIRKKNIRQWTVNADSEGNYKLDASTLPAINGEYRFWPIAASADGFAQEHGSWLPVKDAANGRSIPPVRLRAARKIIGRVLSESGQPTSAIVKAAGSDYDPNNSWWPSGVTADEDGNFQIFVPLEMDIQLMIYAEGHAPRHLTPDSTHQDLGDIALSPGTTVTGKLLDRAGQPVEGAVVALESKDVGKNQIAFRAQFAVLTDADGSFKLPPCVGECKLWVSEAEEQGNVLGDVTIRGITPPPVVPRMLNLDSDGSTKELTLRETSTKTISGTTRWEDGRPAEGIGVGAGTRGIKLLDAKTDSEGRYRMEVPVPLTDVYVYCSGAKDQHGIWHMAQAVAPPPARSSSQFISLDSLDDDFPDADWELRRFEPRPTRSAAEMRADQEIQDLIQKENRLQQKYSEAFAEATTPEQQRQVYMELDPRNVMAQEYLAFERKHRGEDAAVDALARVMDDAASVGDAATRVAEARNTAVDRLIKHYLGHDKLAETFRRLHAGPSVQRADDLLRLAVQRSPHRQVRAAALLTQVDLARHAIRDKERLLATEDRFKNLAASIHPSQRKRYELLRSLDVSAVRRQAKDWLKTIAAEYADIPHEHAGNYGNAAEYNTLALEVVPGETVPELTAQDIHGKPFNLNDLRGKVVVLTFCYSSDDLQNLPNQDLAKKFGDSDAEFVTVVSVYPRHTGLLATAAKQGKILGTIIPRQLFDGAIRMSWGVDGFPTTFLIDVEGNLASVPIVGRSVEGHLQPFLE